MICFTGGRIPRLSLIQHSLYVGVVEKTPPPPLTGEQYGKMEPKYSEGVTARVFYVLKGSLTSPFIVNNSVETIAPFNVVNYSAAMLWAEKLIPWKVSTSCWDQTCDPWQQVPVTEPLDHQSIYRVVTNRACIGFLL